MIHLSPEILNSVIKIKTGDGTGSAFFIQADGTSFLVTAKHIVKNVQPTEKICIIRFTENACVEVSDIEHGDNEADISVIKLAQEVLPSNYSINTRSDGENVIVGQEIAFAGFPLSLEPRHENLFGNKPMPLVKSGIFSGMLKRSFEGSPCHQEHFQYFFDAHNNSGFSGGPILVNVENCLLKAQKIKVIAVVSEYFKDAPIDDARNIRPNSGFMVGIPIGNALKAAKQIIARTPAPDPRGFE